jgi:hypothetical protein
VIFVVFSFLASTKELFLIDANIVQEKLHQGVNQGCELLVNIFMIIRKLLFDAQEKHAVGFDKGLNRGLPSGGLEEGVDCVENPVLRK